MGGDSIKTRSSKINLTLIDKRKRVSLPGIPVAVGIETKEEEEDMGILLGRNPIFDLFKITFEQYNKRVIFDKIDLKWRAY